MGLFGVVNAAWVVQLLLAQVPPHLLPGGSPPKGAALRKPPTQGRRLGIPRTCPPEGCRYVPPPAPGRGGQVARPGTHNCTVHYFPQPVDNFGFSPASYLQRYYVYRDAWRKAPDGTMGPVFFYVGNEAPVTGYVNATGLMWESAEEFGALLVFAEHRYYGASQPTPAGPGQDMAFLSHEQAMADYARLIYHLKEAPGAEHSPVIAFGGSYGGMLAAWMRAKYPGSVHGAIAASAPIKAFQGMVPEWDSQAYWAVVTRDATPAGGSAPHCAANVRAAWPVIRSKGEAAVGRAELSSTFRTCSPLKTPADAGRLMLSLKFAWDTMAMGNFPYPDNYLTGGGAYMPAWPVRAACEYLKEDLTGAGSEGALMEAMLAAAGVYNNASGSEPCLALPDDLEEDGIWDWQWCTEALPQETYFTCDGERDMFWPAPFDAPYVSARCEKLWGVQPRPEWIATSYGREGLAGASNIVFSNGGYDPWSSGGVRSSLSPSVVALEIPTGAHHLDLFFSHPEDPPEVVAVRAAERAHIRAWVAEAKGEVKKQQEGGAVAGVSIRGGSAGGELPEGPGLAG